VNDDIQEYKEELNRIFEKAERMLRAAEISLDDGLVESAASRVYYAVFHAIQALLISVNKEYSKHSSVIAAFNRDFIKTGIFPIKFGKALTRMSKHREIGDYSYVIELDMNSIKEDIESAKEILASIHLYLDL